MAADVWMRNLGHHSHGRWLEGIVIRDLDIDLVRSSSIDGVRRRRKCALELPEADAIGGSSEDARVVPVGLDIL